MKKIFIITFILLSLLLSIFIIFSCNNEVQNDVKKDTSKDGINKKEKIEEKQTGSREIKLIQNASEESSENVSEKNIVVSPQIHKFVVYFDYNGGTGELESKEVIYNEEYGYLPVSKKEGYTFEGWYLDKEFSKKIESTTTNITKGDHILYANYTINKYTITYDLNYLENNLYKNIANKSSWNTDNFEILMDDATFFNENVYRFTSNSEDFPIKYNEDIKLEEGKTYTFSVYIKTNVDKSLLIGFSDELMNIKTDSSWQKFTKTFNASSSDYTNFIFSLDDNFNWNNDDVIEIYGLMLSEGSLNKIEMVKNYNETLGELDNPIRDGYIFDGWYEDTTFDKKIKSSIIVNSGKIYYAKWIPKLYKLEIDPNGGTYEENKANVIFTQGFQTIKKLDKPKASYKLTYDLNNTGAASNKTLDLINRPFKGFIDDENNLYDSNIYVFDKDTKLKAIYDEKIDVKLDSISKTNYTCSWNTKKDGSGKVYDGNSNITINSDTTLYANCRRNINFIRPIVSGCITSEYGYRIHPIYGYGKFHSGIDMSGNDKNIYPVLDGRVVKTGYNSSMGNYIIIYHTINDKNYTSAYYHLELKYVNTGDLVTQNTIIGKMGQTGLATGVHLHLTMYEGHLYNESSKMVNPRDYINFPSNLYTYWQDRGE